MWIMGINFRKQRVRRETVAALYGSGLCMLACARLYAVSKMPGWLLGSLLFGLLVGYGWWVLNQFALLYCAEGDARADERQLALRDRAFFRAYQWICGLLALLLLSWYLASSGRALPLWYPRTAADFNLVFLTFIVVSVTLPHALLAWWEEDLFDESE
jgi:hypothetical protein